MKATLSFQKTSSRVANLSFVVALLLCLLMPQGLRATEVTIGELSSTANSYFPMNSLYEYSYTQQIYTADEIGMAGTINSITMWLYGNTNLYEMPFDIYMMEVDKDAFSSTSDWVTVTAGDIVYSGSVTVHNTSYEAYTFTLNTPFQYSGQGNLLVCFNNKTGSWKSGLNGIVFGSSSDPVRAIYVRRDGTAYDPYNPTFTANGTTYQRNVVAFDITPSSGPACPKPTGLTASLTQGNGTVATLSWVEKGTAAQWQISVDDNTPILVSTNPYTLTGLTAEQAHTAKVRAYCSSSDQSDWSSTVTFTPSNALQTTVNDGTSTNGYVPIYGFYVDNYSYGQFIVPAGDLADMAYGYITKLTFYASQSSIDWGNAQFEVYMMEVDNTTLSSLTDWTTMDKVMNAGSLSVSGNQMVVTLDNHYHYMGDNLLIGFRQTVSGSYVSSTWYGISATGASMGGYGSSISQQNFLPKMTIDYLPGEAPSCPKPTGLTASNVTARSANLSWTAGGTETQWVVEYSTNSDFSGAQQVTATTNPFTLSGLTPEAHYYVRVMADCGSLSDPSNSTNFTMEPSCHAPSDLTAALTPGNGTVATLSWTAGSDGETAWQICVDGDETSLIDVTTNPYTLTGLTAEQIYTAKVRANCGSQDGVSVWSNTVTFEPTEKLVIGTAETTSSVLPTNTYYNYSLTQQIYTPAELGAAGTIQSIDFYSTASERTRSLDIYMVSTALNAFESTDFVSVNEGDLVFSGDVTFLQNAWTTITLDNGFVYDGNHNVLLVVDDNTGSYLSGPSFQVFSTTENQAIRYYSDSENKDPLVANTNGSLVNQKNHIRILMGELPACPKPTGLTASNVAARTATLSWEEIGTATEWQVCLNDNESNLITTSENPFNLTGLEPSTSYTAKVRANCNGSYSDWTSNVSFTTAISCPAPTGLATSNATATSMTLAWTDNATNAQNYQVQYGTLETTTLLNATFESGSIDELGTITNDDTYPWTVTTDAPEGFSGTYCIKSTNSGVGSSTSSFSMTVTLDNDGTISFRGGCWGEGTSSPWDKCIFSIDGTQMFSYGELQTWSNYSFALTAGTHVLAWSYSKDSSVDPTGDAFYVDDIVISTTTLNAIGTVTANSNPYTLQGLEPGTTYTAQVRNFCGYTQDDYSLWTDAVTFTTLPAAPSNLTISDVSYTSALLSWTPGGNETVWFYQLGTDDPIIVTGTNSLFFSNLEPSTTYSVKLRSRIGENLYSEWTAPVEFTTLTCNTPTGLTINNVTSSGVNFSWTPGSNETNWQYMLNSNPAVSVVSNQIFVSELDAATTYTVKVRAQCANNVFSDWTDLVEFTTLPSQAACAAPTGFNATVCGNDATLRWTPGGSETNWMVQYTTTGDYANATTVTLDHPYLPLTGLTSGTTYYAHVKSLCGQDESSWSSTQFSVSGPSCYTAGEGGTTNDSYLPSYSLYNYSLTQQIYTPAEVGVTGSITSLSFYNGGSEKTRTYDLYLVTTSKDAFESTTDWITVTASDKVFSGSVTMVAGDWTTFTLNNPFPYDGTSNLAVIMADNTGSWESGLSCRVFDATNMAIRIYQDASAYDPTNPSSYTGTLMSVKNQIRFCLAPAEVSCQVPTNLTASDVTAHTATITWNAGGSEQTWIYKVGADGAEQEVTNNTITLTDLTAATTYTVYVCAKCSNTDYSCWTSVEFNTEACDPADQCVINYSFEDQYNDSWNGASIDVVDALSEIELAHITMPNVTGPYTGSFSVCPGRDILFIWNSGSYDNECSYEFYDRNGYEIFSGSGAMSEAVTHTVNCTEIICDVPTALAASDITYTGATLSWTAGGTETVWQYSLNDEDPVEVTTNTVSFTDLTPATTYTFKVRAKCNNFNSSEWTDAVEFSTLTCSAPTGLELSTVATTSATIAWNGGTATAWQYRLNGGTPVDVTENPYTITGLDAETGYTVEVRTNCADGVYSAWTDAEEFTTLPSQLPCDVPADLSATVCENDATLRWTASGTETSWTVQYGTSSDFSGATAIAVEQPNTTLSGLASGTTYYVRVKAVCGEDSESGWSSTDFSVAGPNCHTAGEGGTTTNSYLPSYTYYNYSLTQQIYTPAEVGVTGSINSLSFYNGGTEKTRNYDIYLVTTTKSTFSGATDWITVTAANRVFSGEKTMVANEWTEFTLTTPFVYDGTSNLAVIMDDNTGSWSSGMACRIFDASSMALRVYSDGTNYDPSAPTSYSGTVMDVKNQIRFCAAAAPTCMVPENLEASNVAARTATLNWTAGGNEQTWVYKLGENGAEQEVTTNPFTLTDLTPETDYTVYLCAKCSSTDYSCWTSTTFTTTPTCPAPTGLTASNVTSVRATLSWVPGGSENSWTLQYGTAADFSNYTEVEVTSTYQTLTHLEAETPYYARVRANCGTDDISAWSATFEFTPSECHISGMGTSTSYTFPYNYLYNYSFVEQLFTPSEVGGGGEIISVSFYHKPSSSVDALPENVVVYMKEVSRSSFSSNSDYESVTANDIVYSGILTTPAEEGWFTITLNEPFVYNGTSNLMIAFDENTGSYSTRYVTFTSTTENTTLGYYSDSYNPDPYGLSSFSGTKSVYTRHADARFCFNVPLTCATPTNVAVNDVTFNGATASWTATEGAVSYDLRYRTTPDVSLFEDFESGLGSWTNVDADGDGYAWELRSTGTDDYDNPTVLDAQAATSASWISGVGALTPDNWLISPLVDLQGTLSLWLRGQDPDYAAENFAVYLSTTGNAISDFNIVLIPETSAEDTYTEYTVDLSSYIGQQGYIAIRHFNVTDMFYLNLDNVRISSGEYGEWVEVNNLTGTSYTFENLEALTNYEVQVLANCEDDDMSNWSSAVSFTTLDVPCSAPTFLTASDFTLHGGTLSWTAGEITADGWEYTIDDGANWLSDWATTPVQTGSTVTATIDGLEAGQSYEVRVRAICGEFHSRPSNAATVTPTCYPATDLALDEESITTTSAGFNWTSGSNAGSYQMRYATEQIPIGWLQYDNDAYVSTLDDDATERTWGVMYPASLVEGFYLTKVKLYETANNTGNITINIYNGGNNAPGTLLYTEEVVPLGNGWHEISLENPVAVDPEQNLWITLTEEGSNVISLCSSNQVNNTWLFYQGAWNHIGFATGDQSHGFMIRAYMEDVNWITVDDIAGTSYTLEELEPATHYVAQVQSDCGDGDYSTWSNPVQFTTLSTCHIPSDLTVGTVGVITTDLSWTAGEDNETNWRVQYAVNGDWTNAQTVEVSGSPATTLTGLAASTIYKARVKAVCEGNSTSEWTSSVMFTTLGCTSPTNVEATNITHNSATIGWTSNDFAEGYEVSLGETQGTNLTVGFETGNFSELAGVTYTNNSTNPWVVTSSSQGSGHTGTYCIKSGNSGVASSTSEFSITVTYTMAGTISFFGGCWGEGTSWDVCEFKIDGAAQFSYGNLQTWAIYSYNVPAGTHTFTWSYTKDSSVNPEGDAFFVDDIVIEYSETEEVATYTTEENSYPLSDLTPETTYTVRVRTNCGNGNYSDWSDVTFTTLESCPAPDNFQVGNITYSGARLIWDHSLNHMSYQYVVVPAGEQPDWNNAVEVQSRMVTLTDLDDYTEYDAYLRSNCGDGEYSTVVSTSFATPERCAHPDQLTVSNVTLRNADLSWHKRGEETLWILQYGTDPDFAEGTYTELTVTDTAYALTCLTYGTTYYARVQAVCGDDNFSRWSNTAEFTTNPTNQYTYIEQENEVEVVVTQNHTVYDGTTTSSYIPVYGLWADDYLKHEFVIPASELSVLTGKPLSQMTFYLSSSAGAAWTGTFQVFMKEVSETTLSAYSGTSGATIVYTGTLDATGSTMVVNFTQNYTYNGGNLLVGIYETTTGNYKSASFYGQTVSGASASGYNSSSLSNASFNQRNFIPKTTFSYTNTVTETQVVQVQVPAEPNYAGEIESANMETCQSQAFIIGSVSDGESSTYTWYRNGEPIEADNAQGASYTVTVEDLLALEPGETYTYTRKMWDDCNHVLLTAAGEYSISLLEPIEYNGTISSNSPIYCGSTGEIEAVDPEGDSYLHLWYSDPNCQNLAYTGATISLPFMTESDTLWHKVQQGQVVHGTYTLNVGFETGNFNELADVTYTNNSTYPWVVTNSSQGSGHTGTYCIKSGNSGVASSTSEFSITVTYTMAGTISFFGGCWGEGTSWDVCEFKIDGAAQFSYGNLQTWAIYSYNVPAGTHTFTWSYTKDSSVNPEGDAFFVDDIVISYEADVYEYTGCPSLPQEIEMQVLPHPQPSVVQDTVTTYCGLPATLALSETIEGFQYQWSSNEEFTDIVSTEEEFQLTNTVVGDTTFFVRSYAEQRSEEPLPEVYYLLQENFDNGIPSDWTILDADEDGLSWQLGSEPYPYLIEGASLEYGGHNYSQDFVISGSYSNAYSSALHPDNWLITPAISIPANAGVITLSFWAQAQDASYPAEHYGVYISTTGTDPSDFTELYQETLDVNGGTRATTQWKRKTQDLTEYAGQTVRLAIRHFNCSDEFIFNVDDIEVSYQLSDVIIGCPSPAKEVVLRVLPAPAVEVTNEPIVCGTIANFSVNVPEEFADYYIYDWYLGLNATQSQYTGTEWSSPMPVWDNGTSYFVQSSLNDGSGACKSERTRVTVTHKTILKPEVTTEPVTCGTPLTLNVSNSGGDMSGFDYVWYDDPTGMPESAIDTTFAEDPSLMIGAYENVENRTLYVRAAIYDEESERYRCQSEMDTVEINILPIDPVSDCSIFYDENYLYDRYSYDYIDEHEMWDPVDNVCLGDELSLQIGGQTTYLDENNEAIPSYTVWYRRHVGVTTDSVMLGYTPDENNEDFLNMWALADTVGTWQYFAYAATHMITATGEGTLSTSLSEGAQANIGNVTFEVYAPMSLGIDTISLIPNEETATVYIYYTNHANADIYDDNAWTLNGTYSVVRNGDEPVPVRLNSPISVSARHSVWVRIKSAQNLKYEHLDESRLLYVHPSRRVRLSSGYAFSSGTQSSQGTSSQENAKFLGNIHFDLSGGLQFGCVSEESCEKVLVVDQPSNAPALAVTKGSADDADFDIREDGFYVCKSASGLQLTATTTLFGDHANYVWLMKSVDEEEFSEIEEYEVLNAAEDGTTTTIFIPVPDTTTIFGVAIISECCGETDTATVKMYVSEVPAVASIFNNAIDTVLCAPYFIASNFEDPAITNDGDWILSRSWQVSADGEEFTDWDPQQALTTEHNDWYVRYRATTTCLSGYSNAVHIIVDTVAYFPENALVEPEAICGGNSFDWESNTATAIYTNNSEFEIRTGYNLFENGVLTEITPDFVFLFHADNMEYYTYNCYIVTACDSVVSNEVVIPVWATPGIIENLPEPVEKCAGLKIGDYFDEFEDHPDFDDNGSVDIHGWEIADIPGSTNFTVLSDGVEVMDEDVILDYTSNGKVVRYYVENQCGHIHTLAQQLKITDHPYVDELSEMDPVCDGTLFEMAEPEILDDGGIIRYTTGWYFVDPETMEITDTIHQGDVMTTDWDGKMLVFGATNTCGTGLSNGVTITVNPLPVISVSVFRNGVEVEGNEFCSGPDYDLAVNSNGAYLYEWSEELGSDDIVTISQPEEGDYTYSVTATDENTNCSYTAEVSFNISAIAFDTTVTICEGTLPYVFDPQTQEEYEEEGVYVINYTTAEGCDSVVNLTLNVNRTREEHTVIHLCNGQSYEWPITGLTYGGEDAEETVLTDQYILTSVAQRDDVTGELCDSIIYNLRVFISNAIYVDLPQGDEFNVAIGEPVTVPANVRGGCSDDNFKTSVAYKLYKDDELVSNVGEYGTLNLSTYLPVLRTSFGRDVVSGQGEIPGSTFAIQSYEFDYFYSNFFTAVDNNVTATWNEPGDYRLDMVIIRKDYRYGHDFPSTYRINPNEAPMVMGGSNSTPTDSVVSETVSIYFHVEGEYVVEEPEEPTTTNTADLVLDQTELTPAVGETNTVNVTPFGDGDFKVGIDYEVYRNNELVSNIGNYGTVRFETMYPDIHLIFGATVGNGTGAIPTNTFEVYHFQFDYFYMYFMNNLPTTMTATWNVPGEYKIRFTLRERVDGQDIMLTSNNLPIGGHGSSAGAVLDRDSIIFHVDAETVTIDLEETICEGNLPFVYNGHEYTETGSYTFSDENNIYDTVLNLTLNVVLNDTVEIEDAACERYEWNGEEYTESGIYTQTLTSALTGCDSVVILNLTIVTPPSIRINASSIVCETTPLSVVAKVSYQEGFTNETMVSFAEEETSRDTVDGFVNVIYNGSLGSLMENTMVYVTSTNSVSENSACFATDTVLITVIPIDSIAQFTAAVCQGESYEMSEEGWLESFNISAARTLAAIEDENLEPVILRDTIVTGTSQCGTYYAELVLTVNPVYTEENAVEYNDEVCEGYPYEGYGFSITAEEIYEATHTRSVLSDFALFSNEDVASTGCDSVTILRLTVTPTIYDEFDAETCGENYVWNQEIYEESGDYTQTFTSVATGCDSVMTLHLTINQPTVGDTTAVVCNSFSWYEYTDLTVNGDYEHVFVGGNATGCDSTVTLHLTVNHSSHNEFNEVACGSFFWEGHEVQPNSNQQVVTPSDEPSPFNEEGAYIQSGDYIYEYVNEEGCPSTDVLHLTINTVYTDVTDEAEITSAQLPYEWNGVTFTAAGMQVVTLQTVNGCDSIVTMTLTLTDVAGSDPFMTFNMNATGDTATFTAFANQTALSDQVSVDYQLYKNGTLVEDMDYECGGRLYIGTEFQNRLYGTVLAESEGNVPGNTFHISNSHFEYFYWAFFNGRPNVVTHNFTEEGEYTVVLQLFAEEDGTYFTLSYDDDYTHHIGGKNSLPGAALGQPIEITFVVGSASGDDNPPAVSGPTMTITGPANGTVADTMTFTSNGFDNEKVAIRYTIYDANNEPLSMLSSYGSVRIATAYNSTYFGANLTASTGFVPEATFRPSSREFNYFYMGFLATTHNTITANWTVPGTYKITFELVKMERGSDQQLTYGPEYKKLGGRNADVTGVVYDTKTLTYTSGNTAQNPAATGINDGNAEGFVLYPNPAHNRAVLTLGKVSEEAFIVVTDINGKEVHRADITDSRVEFNVSTWSEGVYFVTLRDKDQIVTKKLVVTK